MHLCSTLDVLLGYIVRAVVHGYDISSKLLRERVDDRNDKKTTFRFSSSELLVVVSSSRPVCKHVIVGHPYNMDLQVRRKRRPGELRDRVNEAPSIENLEFPPRWLSVHTAQHDHGWEPFFSGKMCLAS